MGLDAQAVGAVGHGGQRAGGHVGRLAHRVRRVDHDGRPSPFLEKRCDGFVGVVAVAIESRLRTPGAEDDVRIAKIYDVFGGGDELVERAVVHAPLQQHRRLASRDRLADLPEERVVEGITRADLQDLHAGFEREAELLLVHHLGVHRQAGAAGAFHQDIQRAVIALEGIRIGPGLPHSAAQRVGPGFLHGVGRLVEIIRILRVDGTQARHDQQLFPESHPAHFHAVAGEVGLDVHQLVGRLDGVDAVHKRQALEPADHQLMAFITHDGVDRTHVADDRLDAAAELGDNGGELGDFGFSEAVVFRQDHGGGGLSRSLTTDFTDSHGWHGHNRSF